MVWTRIKTRGAHPHRRHAVAASSAGVASPSGPGSSMHRRAEAAELLCEGGRRVWMDQWTSASSARTRESLGGERVNVAARGREEGVDVVDEDEDKDAHSPSSSPPPH